MPQCLVPLQEAHGSQLGSWRRSESRPTLNEPHRGYLTLICARGQGYKTLLQTVTLNFFGLLGFFFFTCQPLFLVLGLFFPGEFMEGAGCSVGGQGRELL